MEKAMKTKNKTNKGWAFAQKHPAILFLLINFIWTWGFWLGAIPFKGRDDLLLTLLVIIGGFGPALAGVLTLELRAGIEKVDFSRERLRAFRLMTALLFVVMGLRFFLGNVTGLDTLAPDLSLPTWLLLIAVLACFLGGWVYSSAASQRESIRSRMGSIFPNNKSWGWILFAMVFYPVMILIAWGLAAILGLGIEFPSFWGEESLAGVLLAFVPIFLTTALMQGGNEEPGWRGLLQPALQKKMSPLVASLIVAVFWSLWHLPLYLNGVYPGDLVGGMLGGFVFRIMLSIFLAWVYNRSGGNLLAMILLHTSFNIIVNFLPTSDLGLTILWLVISLAVVFTGKMWRKTADKNQEPVESEAA
jgi:membrane protease YdiL (CAAX protease family)